MYLLIVFVDFLYTDRYILYRYFTATLVQKSQCTYDATTNDVLQCSLDAYKKYCGEKISTDMSCIVKKSICPLVPDNALTRYVSVPTAQYH